jgi:hypothetical protein
MSEQVGPEVTDSEPDSSDKANRAPGIADFEEQRKTEWERMRLALGAPDRDWKTHPALGTAEFWERRQAEFEKYAAGYADLAVRWGTYRGWYLWQADKPESIEVPKECQRTFDALARKALSGVSQLAALERGVVATVARIHALLPLAL